ncbi:hypothetical protein ACJJTC_014812 [Scirpophaga incertulas]
MARFKLQQQLDIDLQINTLPVLMGCKKQRQLLLNYMETIIKTVSARNSTPISTPIVTAQIGLPEGDKSIPQITDKTETPEVVPAPLASPACPLQTAAKRDNYYIVISDTPAREEIEQTPNFASEEEEIDSVPTEGYTSEDEWSTDADSVCNGRMSVLPWGEDGGPQGPGNREGQGIFSVGKDGPRGVQDTKERAAREGRRKSEPSVRVGAVTGRL